VRQYCIAIHPIQKGHENTIDGALISFKIDTGRLYLINTICLTGREKIIMDILRIISSISYYQL